jgi:hypothetical protein
MCDHPKWFGDGTCDYLVSAAPFGSKPFGWYGIEQQAQIVGDYYKRRSGGSINKYQFGSWVEDSSPPPLSTYRDVLTPVFPGLQ